MEFEPMLTPSEKSPLPENVPRGVSNPRHCGSEPKHYQLCYSGPGVSFKIQSLELLMKIKEDISREARGRLKSVQFEAFWRQI